MTSYRQKRTKLNTNNMGRSGRPKNSQIERTSTVANNVDLLGMYTNPRFAHVAASLIGCVVSVKVKKNVLYEGILSTFSPEMAIVLEVAHKVEDIKVTTRQDTIDKIIFPIMDVISIKASTVDVDYVTRGMEMFIDSAIGNKQNGLCKVRDLEPWEGGEGEELITLDAHANGWSPDEMFRKNTEQFDVKSTYDENLLQYTTPLEKKDTPEYREAEERARKAAREIEKSEGYKKRLILENGDDMDEEDKFSAVLRPLPSNSNTGKYVPPHSRNKGLQQTGRSSRTSATHASLKSPISPTLQNLTRPPQHANNQSTLHQVNQQPHFQSPNSLSQSQLSLSPTQCLSQTQHNRSPGQHSPSLHNLPQSQHGLSPAQSISSASHIQSPHHISQSQHSILSLQNTQLSNSQSPHGKPSYNIPQHSPVVNNKLQHSPISPVHGYPTQPPPHMQVAHIQQVPSRTQPPLYQPSHVQPPQSQSPSILTMLPHSQTIFPNQNPIVSSHKQATLHGKHYSPMSTHNQQPQQHLRLKSISQQGTDVLAMNTSQSTPLARHSPVPHQQDFLHTSFSQTTCKPSTTTQQQSSAVRSYILSHPPSQIISSESPLSSSLDTHTPLSHPLTQTISTAQHTAHQTTSHQIYAPSYITSTAVTTENLKHVSDACENRASETNETVSSFNNSHTDKKLASQYSSLRSKMERKNSNSKDYRVTQTAQLKEFSTNFKLDVDDNKKDVKDNSEGVIVNTVDVPTLSVESITEAEGCQNAHFPISTSMADVKTAQVTVVSNLNPKAEEFVPAKSPSMSQVPTPPRSHVQSPGIYPQPQSVVYMMPNTPVVTVPLAQSQQPRLTKKAVVSVRPDYNVSSVTGQPLFPSNLPSHQYNSYVVQPMMAQPTHTYSQNMMLPLTGPTPRMIGPGAASMAHTTNTNNEHSGHSQSYFMNAPGSTAIPAHLPTHSAHPTPAHILPHPMPPGHTGNHHMSHVPPAQSPIQNILPPSSGTPQPSIMNHQYLPASSHSNPSLQPSPHTPASPQPLQPTAVPVMFPSYSHFNPHSPMQQISIQQGPPTGQAAGVASMHTGGQSLVMMPQHHGSSLSTMQQHIPMHATMTGPMHHMVTQQMGGAHSLHTTGGPVPRQMHFMPPAMPSHIPHHL